MPEGHSVHRVALQLTADFVGRKITVTSPQGRFAAGAKVLTGRTMTEARCVGKQLFVTFDDGPCLRVHLGIYGAWDFAGELTLITPQTAYTGSVGAPRATRAVHIGEEERDITAAVGVGAVPTEGQFPPEPVGQVRARLLTDQAVADLRGPSACEVLDPGEVAAVLARLGPDAANDDGPEAEQEVVDRITRRNVPIARLLMDQSVLSGIGNVYRAELLFRNRVAPLTPGRQLSEAVVRQLWRDWSKLLRIGIETGVMLTRDDLTGAARQRALHDQTDRHWVYGRAGEPCRVCGTPIAVELLSARKLYWCPSCQRR